MYEYDESGRLVSSRPETEWDEGEREWMLALAHYREQLLCPCGCGWPRSVSMDPMTEFNLTAAVPHRCHVRTALIRAQEDSRGRPTPGALLWTVNLRDETSLGDDG